MGNQVNLIGNIVTDLSFNHSLYGESFYYTSISVIRDSGRADVVPVMVSDRIMDINKSYKGKSVYVVGELRTYNQHDEDKNRLRLYVFANELCFIDNSKSVNDVFLEGYICKQPTYRHTPMGREIADVMLAVNRAYGKSDYIPCVMWGRTAYYARSLSVGRCIRVAGRIQSRDYTKEGETKTAYELSVSLLEVC